MTITSRIHEFIDADTAVDQLPDYRREGAYSGAWFETLGGPGEAPEVADQFTPADLVAITTLSRSIPGWGAIDLLEKRKDHFNQLLRAVPAGLDLHRASDRDLEPLWDLQSQLNTVTGVGPVTRSKLLARKRPQLVPIRDQHVLGALLGSSTGEFTVPLRDALQGDPTIVARLETIADAAEAEHLSALRVLDIVVWMKTYGAASVQ